MKKSLQRMAGRIGLFLQQYGRKADRNASDPNDRCYDRKLERRIKALDPRDFDELVNGPVDEDIDPKKQAR